MARAQDNTKHKFQGSVTKLNSSDRIFNEKHLKM